MRNARSRANIDGPDAFRGSTAPRLRSVARLGDRSGANVLARVSICVVLMAALHAFEMKAMSVRCRDVAAGTTPATCVERTYSFQGYANGLGFVCDLESHVGVRPSMHLGSKILSLADGRVSNVRQVLHDYSSCPNLNRVPDQCLGSDMQYMPRYGSLISGHPAEQAPGGLGANGLDGRAGAANAAATVIQFTTVEEEWFGIFRVGGDEHALDAHVDTNYAASCSRLWNVDLVREQQVPPISNALNLGVLPETIRNRPRIVNRDQLPPERYASLCSVEVALPNYRHNRTRELGKITPPVGHYGPVGSADRFADRTRELRCEPHFSESWIVRPCEPVGVGLPRGKGYSGKPVCRFDPNGKQRINLGASGKPQGNRSDCFHYLQ